jgi:hypothetical protein
MMSRSSLAAIAAIAGAAISPSGAANLPDSVWSVNGEAAGVGPPGNSCCFANQLSGTLPGIDSATFTSFYGSTATVAVTGIDLPTPSIGVNLFAGATSKLDTSRAGAIVQLSYYFTAIGPSNQFIPVDFIANGAVFTNASSAAIYSILFIAGGEYQGVAGSSSGDPMYLSVQTGGLAAGTIMSGAAPNSFRMQGQIGVYASFPVEVQMLIEGGATSSAQPTALANATLGPFFYVDPCFPNADQYSIVVSAGIGNAPVPELSSWTLLLFGFAGLSCAGYRKLGASVRASQRSDH